MTNDAVADAVLSLARAAASDELLSDVDSLSAGIEGTGWVRGVNGGQWFREEESDWSLFSGDHAPNLAVFLSNEDAHVVYDCGRELARRLDDEDGLQRHEGGPGWPDWNRDDPRWDDWTGFDADWVTWDGGPALLSLNVRAAYQPGRIRTAPHLHFQIERLDTPAEGLPHDEERDRRVAQTGSPYARWHLAGQMELSGDIVQTLELDDDPAVVTALRAYEKFRRLDAEHRALHPGDEQR